MSKIKICGLTREEDIRYVNECLPDYIGFVFAESRRQVDRKQADRMREKLDGRICPVGVFVNESADIVAELLNEEIIDIAQLHGDEGEDYIGLLKEKMKRGRIIQAVRVRQREDILEKLQSSADYLLFDTYAGQAYGGTGKTFRWELTQGVEREFFLAGGIDSTNIEQAIRVAAPYALDLSSAVETDGKKDREKILEIVSKVRTYTEAVQNGGNMSKGRYGIHGGQYIPETLMNEVIKLEEAYEFYKKDEAFNQELDTLLREYAGRPSLLYYAEKMTKDLGGAKIYFKREDLNHTGSHKINNVLGQALLAKKMGKTRIIAETGAGQHGVATATAAALLGLECEIFMGKEDTIRQALNVYRMELLGAKVHAVESGTMTLKDAVNECMREWTNRVDDTLYVLGSVMGPHPFPMIVRDFQSVISKEARQQILEKEGRLPDVVMACVGGGSNAMGTFYNFINDKDVRLIGCEAAGHGVDTDKTAATMATGTLGIFHGMKSYFCQNEYGQIAPVYSISAGLDYPGVGPEHAHLKDIGRAEYVPVTDEEAVNAFEYIARTEGIIAAIESSHAVAHLMKIAPTMSKDQIIICCLSGRGDKDVAAIARYRGVDLHE